MDKSIFLLRVLYEELMIERNESWLWVPEEVPRNNVIR